MRKNKWHPVFRLDMDLFRKIGRLLLLPVAALLLAGVLMSAGDLLGRAGFAAASVLTDGGFILVDLFPLLIAVTLAAGLSGLSTGTAALAGAAAWLVLDKAGSTLYGLMNAGNADLAPFDAGLAGGVLAGVLAGLLADYLHKLQKRIILPEYLSFFAGPPLTLLLAALAAIPVGLACGAVWSVLQGALSALAVVLAAAGSGGAFVYGLLNRLLLPLGLHHALNQEIWLHFGEFTSQSGVLVQGDFNRFFAGDPTAGRYTAGFYPLMIFVLPAMAAACLLTAKRQNRIRILPVLIIAALAALLSGVTEPLEYLILFTAPVLYLIEALLSGLSQLISYQLQIHAGFRFSAGLTDYLAYYDLAIHPERIWQLGALLAVLSFAASYLAIVFLRLRSPGRESSADLAEPISIDESPAAEPAPAEADLADEPDKSDAGE